MPQDVDCTHEHVIYHKDGTIWGEGQVIDGLYEGYWEWFRKDGTKMRSGYFKKSSQVGEWTTYDRLGGVVKVTMMKGER
jgi:antitoxin component YwqK of YwqJK toxin-antitoxin module